MKEFAELVYYIEYDKALEMAKDWSLDKMTKAIREKIKEVEADIGFYGFYIHMLYYQPIDKHLAIHETLSRLLYYDMADIIGGTKYLALHHLREALQIAPNKEENQLLLDQLLKE